MGPETSTVETQAGDSAQSCELADPEDGYVA